MIAVLNPTDYIGSMIRTTLSKAKKNLSDLVARVGRGETVIVTKRGKPVARIGAVSTVKAGGDDEVVAELLGLGLLRRPTELQAGVALQPPVELPADVSVVDALLEEREEGPLRCWDSSAPIPLLVHDSPQAVGRTFWLTRKTLSGS